MVGTTWYRFSSFGSVLGVVRRLRDEAGRRLRSASSRGKTHQKRWSRRIPELWTGMASPCKCLPMVGTAWYRFSSFGSVLGVVRRLRDEAGRRLRSASSRGKTHQKRWSRRIPELWTGMASPCKCLPMVGTKDPAAQVSLTSVVDLRAGRSSHRIHSTQSMGDGRGRVFESPLKRTLCGLSGCQVRWEDSPPPWVHQIPTRCRHGGRFLRLETVTKPNMGEELFVKG